MERNGGQWFVLHALSGHENKVRKNIETALRQAETALPVYEVLVPEEKITEFKQNKKTVVPRKIFPGYVLVRMDLYKEDGSLDERVWYFIRGIQGVIGFIGGSNEPQPLSQEEVDYILMQTAEPEEKAKPKIQYEIGEIVRIKDGAFENFEGTVKKIDAERGKLELEVSIFGRSTPVELEFWQVVREQ